jgi:hypothetical protein
MTWFYSQSEQIRLIWQITVVYCRVAIFVDFLGIVIVVVLAMVVLVMVVVEEMVILVVGKTWIGLMFRNLGIVLIKDHPLWF